MSTGEYNGLNHHQYIDKNNKFFDYFNFCDCVWCQLYGLPILNEIHLDEGKRYWFEITKNASSSIKDAYEGKIFRICSKDSYHPGNLYHEVRNDEIPIVVYSDPIERFITLLNDYFSVMNFNSHSRFGEDIFEQLIEIGGDTDTNCSMAGQILGTLLGKDNLPKRWIEKLEKLNDYKWIETTIHKFIKDVDYSL